MNVKRIIGLILILVGIGGLFYASTLQTRIDEGGAEGQRKIDQGKSMFKGNPVSEAIGNNMAGSWERDMASTIAGYEQQVQMLRMGSIGIMIVGAAMLIFCSSKKKK